MNKSSVYDHALTLLNEKNIYDTILTLKLWYNNSMMKKFLLKWKKKKFCLQLVIIFLK